MLKTKSEKGHVELDMEGPLDEITGEMIGTIRAMYLTLGKGQDARAAEYFRAMLSRFVFDGSIWDDPNGGAASKDVRHELDTRLVSVSGLSPDTGGQRQKKRDGGKKRGFFWKGGACAAPVRDGRNGRNARRGKRSGRK